MTLATGVLQTLTYSDHFHFPLKLDEIQSRLFFHKPVSTAKIKLALDSLLQAGTIQKQGVYYFLHGHGSYIKERQSNLRYSLTQLKVAKKLASKIHKIPGIYAIYLTGSLAVLNSQAPSDLDFMIIAKPSRLWTTRFLLTIYTSILGLRRSPGSHDIANKLCLNLYLTPLSYLVPLPKRSLYTAYELVQAVPLYDPDNTHIDLLTANLWIRDYLPNYRFPPKTKLRTLQNTSVRNFWYYLEYILYCFQYLYMQSKITREYITPQSAFFHPHDPSPKV